MTKYYRLLGMCLPVILILTGCKEQESKDDSPYAKLLLMESGINNNSCELAHIIGSNKSTSFFVPNSGVMIEIKKISADDNNQYFAPNYDEPGVTANTPVDEVPRTLPQWGVYEIKISSYGEPLFFTNSFKYSGEEIVKITDGNGWALFVTTKYENSK